VLRTPAHALGLCALGPLPGRKIEGHQAVAPAGVLVHGVRARVAVLQGVADGSECRGGTVTGDLRQSIHAKAPSCILADLRQ